MEQLAAYLPMDRRHALARGAALPEYTHGAALFVDISGFTPLTEALARALGPQRGAEELTQHLNTVYTALVDEVHQRRGSVIGFAGDAMTCWFDGDDGRRAVACGLSMQRAMAQFAAVPVPGSDPVSLAAKAALAVGPARRFVVGDPAVRLIDVLAGETLQRMARGEHQATRGEVVADATAIETLGHRVRVAAWRTDEESGEHFAIVDAMTGLRDGEEPADPWPALAPDALPAEMARPWLLGPVYERLLGGQGEFLAELRSAVALFVAFDGIDYDGDPDAGQRLDAFIRRVQHVLGRFEACLLEVTIGDKGSYAYAALGAPLAHDDDDARAIAAALDLLNEAGAAEGLAAHGDGGAERCGADHNAAGGVRGLRIGISRGRVRVGAYGGTARRSYGVMGDEVNVAARLMGQAAPGQILVSERVAAAASRQFDLMEIGPVTLKGKSAPLLVSLVRGRRQPSPRRPSTLFPRALVGRASELEQVDQIMAEACAGHGGVLRIEGVPGVGKSHLAAEVLERAGAAGMRVAAGACQSTTRETAYLPWRQAFRTLLGLDEYDGADQAADEDRAAANERHIAHLEAFAAARNSAWSVRLPLLGDLLGLPIPDNATTAAFEPSLRRNALFDLAWEIAASVSREQPLLVLIDDIHWMDETSRGLTVTLGRALGAAPLLLVLAQRPPLADEPLLPELNVLPHHRQINLDELDGAGVAALVAGRLGGEVSPLALAIIVGEAQGNPFFTEELVDSLHETGRLARPEGGRWDISAALFSALRHAGQLQRVEGEWALAPGAARGMNLGLPDTVEGMVLARVDRLPEQAKLTLRVASVIGRVFPLDVLALAHPLRPDPSALSMDLEMLLARDFARIEMPAPYPSYIFKHTVTHEVAYNTLLFTQRRDLHRDVGVVLEQVAPAEIAQLARHTFLGEDWERSLRYQALAGRQARKFFANHEGIEHFRRALESAEHLPRSETETQRLAIHTDLGELLTSTSQYDQAQEQLGQALALAGELEDREARARVCRWFARLHELRGEFSAALDWIQTGLDVLDGHETVDMAEALLTSGLILNRQGDYLDAERQVRRSLEIGAHIGAVAVRARAYGLLGLITMVRGDNRTAIAQYQQALPLYQSVENIHGQGLLHNLMANAYFSLGLWPDADRHYRLARETFRLTGDLYYEAVCCSNLGSIARDQRHIEDAVSYYQEGLDLLEQAGGSPYMLSGVHMNLAGTLLQRGDLAAARTHLRLAEEYVVQSQLRDFLPELHRLLAQAALVAGDLDTAPTQGQRSLELARELGMQGEEGRTLRVLGDVAQAQGDLDVAEAYLTQSIAILRASAEEFEEARSQLALAQVLIAQGNHGERTRAALERCGAIFERLDAALDLATAAGLLAQLTPAR